MNKLSIYEPAMCCPTGLCGVGVSPELLRVSAVIGSLKKNGIDVQRHNLSSAPQEFINNQAVNDLINTKGIDELPAVVLDEKIVITGRYPTNQEFAALLQVPMSVVVEQQETAKVAKKVKVNPRKVGGSCNCKGGCC